MELNNQSSIKPLAIYTMMIYKVIFFNAGVGGE